MVTTRMAMNLISNVAGNESWQKDGTMGRRTYSAKERLIAAVAQGAEGKREVGSWEDEMEIEQIR